MTAALIALRAILIREALRFVRQHSRFMAALVRPLVWLIVFATGFRAALGLSITPPYQTYITYEIYIVPGLCGMIMLFNGMQSLLSLVYDWEMGSMRLLLTSPMPRWWLLFCRLLASTTISILQVYTFLAVVSVYGHAVGWIHLCLSRPDRGRADAGGTGAGAVLGYQSTREFRRGDEFCHLPDVLFVFFALYPLWKMAESSALLRDICAINSFTHVVELIRFSLYGQFNVAALGWTILVGLAFLGLALLGYDPARGMKRPKG